MTGQITLWGYVAGACLVISALLVGMWVGYGRGWEHCWKFCEEEQREQAAARAVHPVYRATPIPLILPRPNQPLLHLELAPPPVHHEHPADAPRTFSWERISAEAAAGEWIAHEEQALAIANEPHRDDVLNYEHFDCCGQGMVPKPDPRTDSQWTADKAAEMNAFLDSLLNEHPATEEL